MTDLRRYARAPFDCELTYSTPDSGERAGRARDISLGGMFIVADDPPPFGVNVSIRFAVPGEKVELELPAVVRWSGDGGMGVQFLNLGVRETHHITNLTRPPQ